MINVAELEEIARLLGLSLSHAQAEAVVSRFGTKSKSPLIVSVLALLLVTHPLFPSSRHHLSYDDCLEDKRENYWFTAK